MLTIKGTAETELVVKKSRFLGFACRISDEAEALRVLDERRKQHRDARHHCFAYLLAGGSMRCSDDGEPQGTAGLPMLEVIKRSGLADVLIISTRYFGGTLLGAPGLVRAYTQSASDTLKAARRVNRAAYQAFRCDFDFASWARAEKALASLGFPPGKTRYTDTVSVDYCIRPEETEKFLQTVINITQGKISPVPLGTRPIEIDI